MSNPPFVTQFDLNLTEKLKEGLIQQGFTLAKPPYTLFQAKKKGVSCTLYASGKLVVQGSEAKEFIEFYLEPEVLGIFSYGYEIQDLDLTPRIGVDESGKGDFFGHLCIAGVYSEGEAIRVLSKLGVKDSKKISDSQISKIAQKIRKDYVYHIVRIGPKRYNELYEKFGNLNLLLGWGHATVIEELIDKTACQKVIIDKFAAEHVVENALKKKNKQALLMQRTKAEQDLVVAAASILARDAFLEGLLSLEKEWKLPFPKGASEKTVQAGKKFVQTYGGEALNLVSKLHFKTSQLLYD